MSNSKNDPFTSEYDSAIKLARSIDNDLKSRDDTIKKGGNPSKLNQMVQQQLGKLQAKIDGLNAMVSEFESKPGTISSSEADRRRKKVNELRNQYADLNDKLAAVGNSSNKQKFVSSSGKTYSGTIDANNISMQQLQTDKKNIQNSFDQKISELEDAAKSLRSEQQFMSAELQYQSKLIDKIEDTTDKNYLKMRRNNRKLDRLLRKGSDCCLWFILIVELIVLVMLLMYTN